MRSVEEARDLLHAQVEEARKAAREYRWWILTYGPPWAKELGIECDWTGIQGDEKTMPWLKEETP